MEGDSLNLGGRNSDD